MLDEEIDKTFVEIEANELGNEDGMSMMPRACHRVAVRGILEFARELRKERDIYRALLEKSERRRLNMLRELR